MGFDMENRRFDAIEKADSGLEAYFRKIYAYVAGGLGLSALAAWAAIQPAFLRLMYRMGNDGVPESSLLSWIVLFAPFGLIFAMRSAMRKQNVGMMQGLFWLFSALMGLSLGVLMLVYTDESIMRAFLMTAVVFGGMSLYGSTTGRSLASWGSFLMVGLIGLIIAGLVNIFLKSSGLAFGLDVICLFVFVGLTAYDTQKLKLMYQNAEENGESLQTVVISGALELYLDFLNIFLSLLRLFGDRRK